MIRIPRGSYAPAFDSPEHSQQEAVTLLPSAARLPAVMPQLVAGPGVKPAPPWIRLFDDRLNFRYDFDWQAQTGKIINESPQPGEQAAYTASFGREGYCVVACLPKPMNQGTVVLIYGSDLSSLEAGGRFVCDENSLEQLYKRLGVTPEQAPPYVEVLLKTKLLENLAPEFQIIAHRIPKV
ncbi:MAG TPA: hypothetical protein VLY04_22985 [Bryobacteraceae bacterium]|nr:hypothetical protein [Bryobacteraceae bacterium]